MSPVAGTNTVILDFPAYEAFTVGVAGGSVYEVDLNERPNLPDGFKYTDTLLTIDDINEQLLALQ